MTFDTRFNVAFIGKAGSGKTTAAEYLKDEYGYFRCSFAELLKDIAEHIWGEDARADRDKLQKLGVAVRGIDEDAWVNALMRLVDNLDPKYRLALDDCRFPNEFYALKERNWCLIRLEAEEPIRQDRLMRNGKLTDNAQLQHISETALDGTAFRAEYTVKNNGYVEQLYSGIDSIVRTVLGHV